MKRYIMHDAHRAVSLCFPVISYNTLEVAFRHRLRSDSV